jgi:hypothetical protein
VAEPVSASADAASHRHDDATSTTSRPDSRAGGQRPRSPIGSTRHTGGMRTCRHFLECRGLGPPRVYNKKIRGGHLEGVRGTERLTPMSGTSELARQAHGGGESVHGCVSAHGAALAPRLRCTGSGGVTDRRDARLGQSGGGSRRRRTGGATRWGSPTTLTCCGTILATRLIATVSLEPSIASIPAGARQVCSTSELGLASWR